MIDPLHDLAKKRLSAVCGLFCPACTLYIGTAEDPQRLEPLAKDHNLSPEDWACEGCRAERRSYFCEHLCFMAPCATSKGLDFCGQCAEYPCDELQRFQAARPHRIELWDAQQRIAEVGYARWFDEMRRHYACPQCRTINSAYDLACRNCGAEPSCRYVQLHGDAIATWPSTP
jgi:hypothetical protein